MMDPVFENTRTDPRTGRPLGDHGTAAQAIEYALEVIPRSDCPEPDTFLRAWREGDLEEWPEFYDWLRTQEK